MEKKQFVRSFLLGICILGSGLCAGCGSKEDEIAMGRYAEREVTLPGNGFTYMHSMPDGGYYLYGDDVALSKVDAEGKDSESVWSWENNANIHIKFSYGVSDDGAVIFGYTPRFYSNEEYEAFAEEGEYRYLYDYVDAAGTEYPLALYGTDYKATENLEYFAFAPDERLYGASASMMYRIHVENGEAESLFQTAGQVNEIAFLGDTMIALDDGKAYLYDMAGEKLLEDNSVLNEFVASHQNGVKSIVLAVSEGNTDMTYVSDDETADKETESPNTVDMDSPILYLGCRTGLYRYIWGGSVIEQIADGRLLSFGNSQYTPLAMQALAGGKFRVLFSGNRMTELYYDETLPARPSKELTVYSLEENGRIRYAGQLFQQEHPDVIVNYETGMDGDNAVSKEDALKNLNTRLLAGEGPDVIVLDGVDMEQYADKGVLKPLDDFLTPYMEEGILYQNIVEGMRITEDEKIYGVPLTVYLPIWLSEKQYLEGEDSLEDIVAGMEKARADHPEGPLLFTPYPEDLLDQMIPACLPAWTLSDAAEENGSLNTEKLTEFYEAMDRLWELDSAGLDEEARTKWQQDVIEIFEPEDDINLLMMATLGQYEDYYNIGENWAQFGCLLNCWFDLKSVHAKEEIFANGWSSKKVEDEIMFSKYIGQADNVYWARTVTGLCEQAKEPELAEEFLTLLLSGRMADKWWLEGQWYGGITIRRDSLEKALDRNNHEFAQVKGWDDAAISQMYGDIQWFSEADKQWLYQMMEDADCCYRSGTMLGEVAKEVGLQVLDGSLTPEEGAKEVARRMAIEMEE